MERGTSSQSVSVVRYSGVDLFCRAVSGPGGMLQHYQKGIDSRISQCVALIEDNIIMIIG